jgi:hypothetical protein
MQTVFARYATRENVLAVISVCAFAMSLTTWITTWIQNRQRIRLHIDKYSLYGGVCVFKIGFTNE